MKKVVIITLALFIGIIVALPHIYGLTFFKNNYSPFKLTSEFQFMQDESYAYAAQVQQYLNMNIFGDQFTWEYRNGPSLFMFEAGSILSLTIISILSQSVEMGFILADIIFSAILFLVIFYLLQSYYSKNTLTLAVPAFVIMLPFFSSLIPFVSKEGSTLTGYILDPLFISRTPHPQISLIFLCLSIIATILVLKDPERKYLRIWSLVIGISLYSSFFVSSTIVISQLIVMYILLKKIGLRKLLGYGLIIFLIAVPLIANLIYLQLSVSNTELFIRTTYPQNFLFPLQLRYILFGLIFFLIKRNNLSKILFIYIASASFIADFHQLLIGRSIDADHWLSRVITPISTLVVLLIINEILRLKLNIKNIFWLVVFLAVLLIGTIKQVSWIELNKKNLKADPNYSELIRKIKKDTDKDAVIASINPNVMQNITGQTGRWVYLGSADRTIIPQAERIQRVCSLLKYYSDKEIKKNIVDLSRYTVGNIVWKEIDKTIIVGEINRCSKDSISSNFKLDYFVHEKEDDSLELFKVN